MKPSSKPTFSVIVPAYNEEKLISQCLKSLIHQDFNLSYEIILVNNNSTDKTVDIAKKFNVKIVEEKRQGLIFAKQRGFLSSQGKYIVTLDADSIAPTNWLSKKYYDLQPSDVVASTSFYSNYDGPWYHQLYLHFSKLIINLFYFLTHRVIYLSGSNTAFKKTVAQKFGGFNIHGGTGIDEVGFMHDLAKHGRIYYDPNNVIQTSSRRSQGGFLNFSKQILVNYIFNLIIFKITGKRLIDNFTDFR